VNSSLAAALAVVALLVLSSGSAASADTFVGGTNAWTLVGSPSSSSDCIGPCELLSYSSHLSVSVQGIVLMVLRNNSSQMVYLSTASATIASEGIAQVYLVEFGLAPGTYNATFFALSFAGVAISLPTSATFTVPGA